MDTEERARSEETLFEPPTPRGGALPPHLLTNRPFLWVVVSTGLANLAFWGYLGVVWARASFDLHASAAQMSILLGSFSLPFVLFVPLQGTAVDRWSPKWLNVFGTAIWIGAIPIAWGAHSLGPLYLSGFVTGIGVASIIPTRSALTGLLVPEDHLIQANGMLSVATQSALIAGPLAGAFLLRTQGAATVYVVSLAVASLGVGVALLIPDIRHRGKRHEFRLADVGRGFLTSWRIPELRLLLLLYGTGWLVINMVWSLEPLFLKNTMHLRGDSIQVMWASHGAGATVGALALSRTARGRGRELFMTGAGIALTGASIVVYIGAANFPVAIGTAVVGGVGFSYFLNASIALIQRVAGEEEWGRVTSVFAILQEGSGLAVSALVVALGSLVVVRPTLLLGGVTIVAVSLLGLRALTRQGAGPVAVMQDAAE